MSPIVELALVLSDFTPAPGLPSPRPGLDPDKVTPGVIGLVWFLVMVLALVLLVRNMIGRIKRVPKDLNVPIPRHTSGEAPAGDAPRPGDAQAPAYGAPPEATAERESS